MAFYGKIYLPGVAMASNCTDAAIHRVRKVDKTGGTVIAEEGPWKGKSPFSLYFKQGFDDV